MAIYDMDDILAGKETGRSFPSSLNILNKLFNGNAYNSYEINGMYGKPQQGKTLFAAQEVSYLSSKGFTSLFIGTEDDPRTMLKEWACIFEKRFGKRKGKIFVVSKKNVESLLDFMGYKVELKYKQSKNRVKREEEEEKRTKKATSDKNVGKIEFRFLGNIENKLAIEIEKRKIDFLVLDSLTSPLRSFTNERQNRPARADCTSFILRELVSLQERFDIGVLVTHHAIFDPTNQFKKSAIMAGGAPANHYHKRIIYLDIRDKKEFRDYRRFHIVRCAGSPAPRTRGSPSRRARMRSASTSWRRARAS